jgi:hypothetical protein
MIMLVVLRVARKQDCYWHSFKLDSSMIPEKHCKAWELLTAKRYKLKNVQQSGSTVSHDTDAIICHHSMPIVTNTVHVFSNLCLSSLSLSLCLPLMYYTLVRV